MTEELKGDAWIAVADELKERLQLQYTAPTKDGSRCHLVEIHLIALAETALREAALIASRRASNPSPEQGLGSCSDPSPGVGENVPSEGWVLVPREPTEDFLVNVAPRTEAASEADYDLARRAIERLPFTDHPQALDVLAELARDYRTMIAALSAAVSPTNAAEVHEPRLALALGGGLGSSVGFRAEARSPSRVSDGDSEITKGESQ